MASKERDARASCAALLCNDVFRAGVAITAIAMLQIRSQRNREVHEPKDLTTLTVMSVTEHYFEMFDVRVCVFWFIIPAVRV